MKINDTTILSPSVLREEIIQIQTEQYSVDGTVSRNKTGQKWQATAVWENISPADYRTIRDLFITGSGVYYYNDASAENSSGILAFSGMPFMSPLGDYVPGSSLNKTIQARIREI